MEKKENLLVMSISSFSQSVFKKLIQQTRKNKGMFGKALNLYYIHDYFDASTTDSF